LEEEVGFILGWRSSF